MSTFTVDFPYTDINQNRRLGYKLPIEVIMPQYMKDSDLLRDLYECIDIVFDKRVYDKTEILSYLRNMWVSNPDIEEKILNKELLDLNDWSLPERVIVGKQLNLLGLHLGESASLFSAEDFIVLCRYLGMYWFKKGTKTFMDFVNFCCNTHYRIQNLWTNNYVDFVPEGDERIGTPVWENGSWYPTTHVSFVTTDGETNILALALLFKEIANYNLVLDSILVEFNMDITTTHPLYPDKKIPKLLFGTHFDYYTSYKLYTLNQGILDGTEKQIFGFKDTKRYGFDLASFDLSSKSPNYHLVSVQQSKGGNIEIDPSGYYPMGTKITVSYTLDDTFYLVGLYYNNNLISGDNFLLPNEDAVVTGIFHSPNDVMTKCNIIYDITTEEVDENNEIIHEKINLLSIYVLRKNTKDDTILLDLNELLQNNDITDVVIKSVSVSPENSGIFTELVDNYLSIWWETEPTESVDITISE